MANKKTTSSSKQRSTAPKRLTANRVAGIVVVLAIAAFGSFYLLRSNADSLSNETNGANNSVMRPSEAGCASLKRAWTGSLCQWSQTYVPAPNPYCADQAMAYWKAVPNDFCAVNP